MSIHDALECSKLCLLGVPIVKHFIQKLIKYDKIILDMFLVDLSHDSFEIL